MSEVKNNFNGYINIEKSQFVFTVENHFVKLIPLDNQNRNWFIDFEKGKTSKDDDHYLYGMDDSSHKILFYTKELQKDIFHNAVRFFAPLIIKGVSNVSSSLSYSDLTSFDAVVFSGGTINKAYSPKFAVDIESALKDFEGNIENGAKTIKIKPFNEYTENFDVVINEQKAKLTYSIQCDGKYVDRRTDELGRLTSFIRIEFEQAQPIESLVEYYRIIKTFVSFLVAQHNIEFHTSLSNRVKEGINAGKFIKIGECKTYENYTDFCPIDNSRVIPLSIFRGKLNSILKVIADNQINIRFLPYSNKEKEMVDYDKIREICATLEAEYDHKVYKNEKDEIINCLKKIVKSKIDEFKKGNPLLSDKTYGRAKSSLKYWDLPAEEKIYILYQRYEDQIETCCQKLNAFGHTVKIDENRIVKFVNIRNGMSHTFEAELTKEVDIFILLRVIVYLSIFDRIGFKPKDVAQYVQTLLI